MARFSVRFLGCKVSHTDAQALRERLLGDGHTEVEGGGDVGAIGCVQAPARLERVRAFVKIQDGCSFSCAFCVIPLVRGATRSRSAESVLAEIRRRVAQGHREIVLTGVNLGCFRDRSAGTTLAGLIRAAGAIAGVERLRLSSIEINHVDDELVAALRETPVVGPHLHVPLQSGDDGVLRAMARRYSAETYLRKLEPLADFNLTADVIVGFPAEDDAAFERTLETVRAARLTKVHVFPYSPRPGTRTAAEDTVPPEVKKERSARLRALSDEACRARWTDKLGRAEVARDAGLEDYRVLVNVGPGGGQTIFHLHWHVLGGKIKGFPE